MSTMKQNQSLSMVLLIFTLIFCVAAMEGYPVKPISKVGKMVKHQRLKSHLEAFTDFQKLRELASTKCGYWFYSFLLTDLDSLRNTIQGDQECQKKIWDSIKEFFPVEADAEAQAAREPRAHACYCARHRRHRLPKTSGDQAGISPLEDQAEVARFAREQHEAEANDETRVVQEYLRQNIDSLPEDLKKSIKKSMQDIYMVSAEFNTYEEFNESRFVCFLNDLQKHRIISVPEELVRTIYRYIEVKSHLEASDFKELKELASTRCGYRFYSFLLTDLDILRNTMVGDQKCQKKIYDFIN